MIEDFYRLEPYELEKEKKQQLLMKELMELTEFHRKNCMEYSKLLNALGYRKDAVKKIEDIPFYPVRMFKEYELLSVSRKEIFKTMTSSGTTGQAVSKIFVDKDTAMIQQKVMIKILSDYWGKKRLPMLIIDSPSVVKDRKTFSARGAAIIGLNIVSRDTVYVLNEDMSLNLDKLKAFLEKYKGQRFIMFGFTFIVWQHFYQELLHSKEKFDLSEGFLMTGGGWKRLESEWNLRSVFKIYVELHIF